MIAISSEYILKVIEITLNEVIDEYVKKKNFGSQNFPYGCISASTLSKYYLLLTKYIEI